MPVIIKEDLLMLWDLFLTFFKMGAVTFGGGYAMLPILQREVAENKKWRNCNQKLHVKDYRLCNFVFGGDSGSIAFVRVLCD